jgi:hypothetical protein
LRFVGDEQEIGGLTTGVGAGSRGDEPGAGLAQGDCPFRVRLEHGCGERVGHEAITQSVAAEFGLWFERWRGNDDRAAVLGVAKQEQGGDLGQQLVFSRLPGKDDGEVQAAAIDHAFDDCLGGVSLVFAKPMPRHEGG